MRLITIILAFMTLMALIMIREGSRTMAENSEAVNKNIPLVDRDIPAKIETATFALG